MNRSSAFTKDKKWPTNTYRLITWLNKIKAEYSPKHPGEITFMFNKNALHLLFDGKLEVTLSIKHLVQIIN